MTVSPLLILQLYGSETCRAHLYLEHAAIHLKSEKLLDKGFKWILSSNYHKKYWKLAIYCSLKLNPLEAVEYTWDEARTHP